MSEYVPSSFSLPDKGAPALANVDRSLSNSFFFLLSSTMGTLSMTRTLSNPSSGETAYLRDDD